MGQEPAPVPDGQEPPAPKPDAEPKAPESGFDSLPAETQKEIRELRAESAKWRTEAQQRQERLDEIAEQDKSELEKAQGKVDREKARADAAEAKLLRYEVARDKEVPAVAVDFLQGNTREELEASADKLLALVSKGEGEPPAPDFNGGAREPAPEPKSPEDAHNAAILQLMGLSPPSA